MAVAAPGCECNSAAPKNGMGCILPAFVFRCKTFLFWQEQLRNINAPGTVKRDNRQQRRWCVMRIQVYCVTLTGMVCRTLVVLVRELRVKTLQSPCIGTIRLGVFIVTDSGLNPALQGGAELETPA
jgi:hypothetical protein